LIGTIPNSLASSTFITIDAEILCDPASIKPDSADYIVSSPHYQTKDYSYTVYEDVMKIYYKPFNTIKNCEVSFSSFVGLDDGGKLPDFIEHKFDINQNYFEV
jgi:hypothetical protein